MIISLINISSSLGTRQLGAKLRSEIEQMLQKPGRILIDFSGIEVISNSFADECFGKLLLSHDLKLLTKNLVFKNANEFIQTVIKNSFFQRVKQIKGEC
ncbi:MAG: STAS-like domain-containing protein [Bacteroidetes bacterium]|nr:STAS-like domain-containing protein [Bacteroidota bacterium]